MSGLVSGMHLGSYRLLNLIGETRMSEVWRALDWQGNPVAVKTILTSGDEDPQLRARFLREGGEHQLLSHPSIVPILDFFEQDGRFYLAMQYLSGGSLADRLEQLAWKPLPIREALEVARCILPALDYAHQRLVIHRDVKPSNILLEGERAFLGDFGIALALGRPRLTTVSQVLGTRCYMSPEQIRTPLTVTHLTDVYSFGCVLYEMLTGHQPFDHGEDTQQGLYDMLAKRIHEPPVPPRQWNPLISARLERVVLTSLAVEPEDRFPGCGSFARALEGLEQESPAKLVVVPASASDPVAILTPAPTGPAAELPAKRAASHVSVGGNMAAAFVAGFLWILFTKLAQNDLTAVIFLCYLVSTILLLRVLWKAWDALPASEARVAPGKAVGFLFIPFYSLYWCWIAIAGYAIDYNHYRKRIGGEQHPQLSQAAYKLFCLYHFYLPVAAVFIPQKEVSGWIILLDMMVITPIMIGSMARAINSLPAVEVYDLGSSTTNTRQGVR